MGLAENPIHSDLHHRAPDRRRLPQILRTLAALATAALLTAAFPPFNAPDAAWAALVPLLLLCVYTPPRAAFRWAWAGGFAFWLATLSWLLQIMHTGGYAAAVIVGWVLLSAYCALYLGLFALLASEAFQMVGVRTGNTAPPRGDALRRVGLVLLLPILWVGCEFLRAELFTGFGWNALGVSQYRANLALIQLAEWGGVYAVSFVIVAMNVGLALTAGRFIESARHRVRLQRNFELTVAIAICLGALYVGLRTRREYAVSPEGSRVRVTAVNPDIPQVQKWDEHSAEVIVDTLTDLTEKALVGSPHLVVWPETTLPNLLRFDETTQAFVGALARKGSPLFVGSMDMDDDGSSRRFYNSAFLVSTNGALEGDYQKRHLVPFGEYIPLDCYVPLLSRFSPLGVSCTPGRSATVFRIAGVARRPIPFAALICFEDTIAALSRDSVRNGARLLVNLTNDAWFDKSAGALQHMSHCVFRCIENRVPAVRCANQGVTCFIDRSGAIDKMTLDLLCQGEALAGGYRTEEVGIPSEDLRPTFYNRHGDWPFAFPCAVVVVAGTAFWWRLNRRVHREETGNAGKHDGTS
jgi:apolipoprotein N-acyltransferase